MDLTLLYFDGCPNWKTVAEQLAAIARERPGITVTHHRVDSAQEAERLGFHGSPSIMVDGKDLFPSADTAVGLSCRVYQTPAGPAGAPTAEQLQAALAQA